MSSLADLNADTLDRMVKLAMDSAEAATYEDAVRLFRSYRLAIVAGEALPSSPTLQLALLTLVRLAVRVFKGGVFVAGAAGVPSITEVCFSDSLDDELVRLGAVLVDVADAELPRISVGTSGPGSPATGFSVRLTYDGWRCGVVPTNDRWYLPERKEFTLSGVAAAALAVNEAFLSARGDTPKAGRRRLGLSLWDPMPNVDWADPRSDGPAVAHGPARLWLIGLGHLGQAHLWALGALCYTAPAEVELLLQDFDIITPSTTSTSILTDISLVGQKKTRAMAAWAERRGFRTRIVERLLNAELKRSTEEPGLCLCGIDNAAGRAFLEDVGFDYVIEAGLGSGAKDFRAIRLHTFPSTRKARQIWGKPSQPEEASADQPAYANLVARGLERCGVTTLAGRAIGAPFVGCLSSALVVAEAVRLVNGGPAHGLIDLDLKDPDHRVVIRAAPGSSVLNPGIAPISRG